MNEKENDKHWDSEIKKVEMCLNTTFNKSTNKTPFEALFGYKHRYNEGLMRTLTVQEESYTPPEELHEEVRESIVKEQSKYKENYDKKRYSTTFYNIGDIVYMQSNPVATGKSTKFQQKFKGPFIIYKILPGDTYGITDLNPAQKGSRYASTAHVSQLKQWKPCVEDDPVSDDNSTDEETNKQDKNSRPMRRTSLPQRYQDFVLNRQI
ncbi:hypothetical protein TKK_0007564 [Trichogramma kaykai]